MKNLKPETQIRLKSQIRIYLASMPMGLIFMY